MNVKPLEPVNTSNLLTPLRSFISFDDLQNLLGNSTEHADLERIWRDSLKQCKTKQDGLSYADFKKLMKGQPKDQIPDRERISFRRTGGSTESSDKTLGALIEGKEMGDNHTLFGSTNTSDLLTISDDDEPLQQRYIKKKSRSHEFKSGIVWDDLERTPSLAFLPPRSDDEWLKKEAKVSPLVNNRNLYRRHRGMRLAVLEASKRFDKKRNERLSKDYPIRASLIMKRGMKAPLEIEDAHTRALFDAAARRCGRSRRTRNKTVSDVTGMLMKEPPTEE